VADSWVDVRIYFKNIIISTGKSIPATGGVPCWLEVKSFLA